MNASFLEQAFPFCFAIDRQMVVAFVGPSLRKLSSGFAVGESLHDIVIIEHPSCSLEYAALTKRRGKQFRLTLTTVAATLRGQWIELEVDPGETLLVFAGSLWADSVANLRDMGLDLSDFAPHDPTIEGLMIRQGQITQANDHRRLVERLEFAAQREIDTNCAERALAHDLDLSADVLLRFTRSGELVAASSSNPLFISIGNTSGGQLFEDFDELGQYLFQAVERLDGREQSVSFEFELEREGKVFYFDARVGKTLSDDYLLIARDITEQKQIASRMVHLAQHDPLTDLPNRSYFGERIEQAISRDQINALLLIDLNEFKAINDCHGHPVGDIVLKSVASRLRAACRIEDLPARIGGDEFAMLAENLNDPQQAKAVANRVLREIVKPLRVRNDLVIHPKASVGVVIPQMGDTVEEVFRNVDIAMYNAKGGDSNGDIICFEQEMLDVFLGRVELRNEFQLALERNELVVLYQPIIDLSTDRITKCEALVRWQHPSKGLLSPFHFVPLAEETGAICEMGRQVLRQACSDLSRWTLLGYDVGVTVNVSPLQLLEDEFVAMVLEDVRHFGISPEKLTLEITESTFVSNPQQTRDIITELTVHGISTAIDDFGVGYSSLQYLSEFPADILKIDKSFVQSLDNRPGPARRVVEAMVNLGKTLGMEIVAEGIEEKSHERQVRELGCNFGQGYLYSRPVAIEVLIDLIDEGQKNEGQKTQTEDAVVAAAGE